MKNKKTTLEFPAVSQENELKIRMLHLVTAAPFGVDSTALTRLSDVTFNFELTEGFIFVTKIVGGGKFLVPLANVASIVLK